MILDRTSPPAFTLPKTIPYSDPGLTTLSNGLPLYIINRGSQPVSRLDLIFPEGSSSGENDSLVAFAFGMLKTGTDKLTAMQIAEHFDFFGAFTEYSVGKNRSRSTMYSLNKFLPETLPVFTQIHTAPTFPMDEFEIYANKSKQRWKIAMEKVTTLARREFVSRLFGEDHPYGRQNEMATLESMTVEDVRNFFKQSYALGPCCAVLSGAVSKDDLRHIGDALSVFPFNSNPIEQVREARPATPGTYKVIKSGAVQSALRIGRRFFNRHHPDYNKFQVLSTLLGGYFGSRLMANIREDKGYTYGIGCGVASLQNAGYFFISTEVGAEVTEQAIGEIFKELNLLRSELVPQDELTRVKSYMLGEAMRETDGAFALSDIFKNLHTFGMNQNDYGKYIQDVISATPEDLIRMAGEWLNPDDMIVVIAGN